MRGGYSGIYEGYSSGDDIGAWRAWPAAMENGYKSGYHMCGIHVWHT